ncbi:MAG TPA: MerR family DNA-binding protein [Usitatibacter sp.]|nr:MerR family DNA-binding protein [Usitatibacter sp.]
METLTIGQVAKSAGVHTETIRYYQSLGLVEEPPRRHGTVRRYPPTVVSQLVFIKRAQQLGFTLEEVRKILPFHGETSCAATRKLAEHKLEVVRGRIAELNRVRRSLQGLIARCNKTGQPAQCPIIHKLSEGLDLR